MLGVGVFNHHLDVLIVARGLKQALFKILLIVAVLNRVGVNLAELVLLLVHRGGLYDDTAVKSARQKHTQRNVADKLALYRVGQQVPRFLNRLLFIVGMLLRFNAKVRFARKPVVFVNGTFAGVKLKNALEHPARGSSRGTEEEYLVQSLFVDLRFYNRAFEQGFYLYMILTKPTMGLYISTTQRGFDGKEAKPSYLMQEMMQYFPDCRIHRMDAMDLLELAYHPAALDELLILLLRDFMENENQGDSLVLSGLLLWYQKNDRERLKEILSSVFYVHEPEQLALASGEKLSRSNLQGSVTKLEKYASCAYAYFLQYGLHLGERQEHELDQMDVGNLYHDVLKKYSDTLMNDPKYQAYDFSTVTDQISDEILKSCIAESYEKMWKQELFMDPRSAYTLREMQSTLKRSIQLLRNQVQRGRFLPQAFEVKLSEIGSLDALNYELSNGDLMHFSGQIDRIDTMETDDKVYVKIIDYKSGSQTLDPARVKAGLQIQILVYMDAALEGQERSRGKETVPAAVYLYHVKDQTVDEKKGDMTEDEIREEVLKAVGRDGLINEDETVLYALDEHPGGKNSLTSPVYPSKSSRISEKRFREILGEVRELIQTEGEEIRKGNIQAMPYRMKDANGCAYCSYHAICGFDPSLEGYDYRDVDPYVTWKGEEDV